MTDGAKKIGTERLILRKWRESDREPFSKMNCDPLVMEHFPALLSREDSDALVDFAEAHLEQHGFGPWAAELRESQEFIGYVGLVIPRFEASFTPCVEIGWRLARKYWGKGLATEGARALASHGFEVQRLLELVSFTVPSNVRSLRVMQKLGMTHDPRDDFDHPSIPAGHPLQRHVLYRLKRDDWMTANAR
ncbi:MAG TPA: GNAT family N-acetyltransferase [Terracidiphilus sp.]|jgi:RimJ/RimL family protein N-acetyltransferase|nr:GNAT family N-acetyltransferase [Terracidiphilus sp.]